MVEIQYVCGGSNSGPSTIQWVRETKICVYEAQVTIPELCNLELLAKNEDQKNASPILCRMPAKSKIDSNSIDLITKYEPIFLGSGIYFLRPFNTDERDKLMVTDNAMSNWDEITETYYQKFGNAINKMLSLRLVSLPNGHILQPGDSCVWLAEVVDMKDRFQTTLSLNILNSQRAEIFFNKTFTFNEDNGNFLSYKIGDHGESTELGQITHSNKADINTAEIRSDEYLINTDNELFLRISKEIAEVKELLNEIVSPHEMEVIFENMRNQPNNDFELALMNKLKSSLNDDNKVEQINNARMDDDESTSHTTRDIGEAGSQTTGNTESEVTNVAAGVFIEHDEL